MENTASHLDQAPTINPEHSFNLNSLYAQWNTCYLSEQEHLLELLLKGVQDFANHTVWKNFRNVRSDHDDVVQTVMIKVARKIQSFTGTSKFTTWVFTIIRSTALDFIRATNRKREVQLPDNQVGETNAPARRGKFKSAPQETPSDGEKSEDEISEPISKQQKDAVEDELNAQIDLDLSIRNLTVNDKRLFDLMQQNSPEQVRKILGCSEKQIRNRYHRILRFLKCDVLDFKVLVHTCPLNAESTYCPEDGRNVRAGATTQDGVTRDFYQALSNACRCQREVNRRQSLQMIENGSASAVFKVKDGKPFQDEKVVWSPRAIRVPRAAASNASVEKIADGNHESINNLDIGFEISQQCLKSLIVPFRRDPFEGEAILKTWADQRTPHSHGRPEFEPRPTRNKPTEYFPINIPDGGLTCPKCETAILSVSIDAVTGATRHECSNIGNRFPCCYLAVWKIPEDIER